MSLWGLMAGIYGAVLTGAALALPIARRPVAATGCAAYMLVALGAGTLTSSFWAQLLVPAGLLLCGYWLSGFFFRTPQPWLERWLLETDRRTFRALAIDAALRRMPCAGLELLEGIYSAVYLVVTAGALVAASAGIDAVTHYWNVVLLSELACYVALPWLRSRPPRAVEPVNVVSERAPALRRVNMRILDRASVQANTLPSGHVAGAVAAALGIWPVAPTTGAVLLVIAALIAVAAVTGRYHYVVDCIAGASVGVAVWSLV